MNRTGADNDSGITREGGVGFQILLFNRLQYVNIFHKSVLQEGIRKLEQPKTAGIRNEGAIAPCEYYSHGAMAQGNAFHIVCCQSKNTSREGA